MNKNYINGCLRWLANELVPFYNSKTLPKSVMSKLNVFYESIEASIDWERFSRQDLLTLGFLNWEEHDTPDDLSGVWFIPHWLFPIIPDGMKVYTSDGESFFFDSETAPTEVLYGCLTFGIMIEPVKAVSTDE